MRNSNVDYYFTDHDDERDELIAMVVCIASIIFLGGYMLAVIMTDFATWWGKALAIVLGFFLCIYTIGFIIIGVISIYRSIKGFIRRGIDIKGFLLFLSKIGMYLVSQLFFNFLFWGIIRDVSVFRTLCIPTAIIAGISIAYVVRYLATEV